jgi:hypothetical protein
MNEEIDGAEFTPGMGNVVCFASTNSLREELKKLKLGEIVLVGYVGEDGDVHALTENDLKKL